MAFVRKADSRLMRLIGWLLSPITPRFMSSFWTTIGAKVYVPANAYNEPDYLSEAWLVRHRGIIAHESVHIAQFKRFTLIGMAVLYLGPSPFVALFGAPLALILGGAYWGLAALGLALILLPLSVGLAWGRWYLERQAYGIGFKGEERAKAHWIAYTLWANYFYTWPRSWVVRYFERVV